jgi:hypothetical protein
MSKPTPNELSLKATQAQVLAAGREWTRQRLQQRLQGQARAAGAVFPLRQRQTRPLRLHTVVGEVTLAVDYGRDPQTGKWVCPAREHWGLGPHQKMTPELEDRVCLRARLADSYQAAGALSAKWGGWKYNRLWLHDLSIVRQVARPILKSPFQALGLKTFEDVANLSASSARLAGFQLVDHPPDAIRFSAFDHLEWR